MPIHSIIFNDEGKHYPMQFETFKFPSGSEVHFKLTETWFGSDHISVKLNMRIDSSDDIMLMLFATDALRRRGFNKIELVLHYLPYARQDRVMTEGEPLSIKVMADIINYQNYTKVTIFDPHSDVSAALINNVCIVNNHEFVQSIFEEYRPLRAIKSMHCSKCGLAVIGETSKDDKGLDICPDCFNPLVKDKSETIENIYIVCPDAGAYKKIYGLCQSIGYFGDIIMCNKVRDLSNGYITEIKVDKQDLQGKDCWIVDDICSKGGTFMLLAQELKKRNAGKIYLIVSHYENTADLEKMKEAGIEKIFKTDSMNDFEELPFVINTTI